MNTKRERIFIMMTTWRSWWWWITILMMKMMMLNDKSLPGMGGCQHALEWVRVWQREGHPGIKQYYQLYFASTNCSSRSKSGWYKYIFRFLQANSGNLTYWCTIGGNFAHWKVVLSSNFSARAKLLTEHTRPTWWWRLTACAPIFLPASSFPLVP